MAADRNPDGLHPERLRRAPETHAEQLLPAGQRGCAGMRREHRPGGHLPAVVDEYMAASVIDLCRRPGSGKGGGTDLPEPVDPLVAVVTGDRGRARADLAVDRRA